MKFAKSLILFVALLAFLPAAVAGQESDEAPDPAQTVDNLRFQLLEVESRQAELEARSKQLDEEVKPENIERALAGVGSTRPEELREYRRRQLTIERDGVQNQLRILARSKERLELAIRSAETQAYQQSALVEPPVEQALIAHTPGSTWRLLMLTGLLAIAALLAMIMIAKRAAALSK